MNVSLHPCVFFLALLLTALFFSYAVYLVTINPALPEVKKGDYEISLIQKLHRENLIKEARSGTSKRKKLPIKPKPVNVKKQIPKKPIPVTTQEENLAVGNIIPIGNNIPLKQKDMSPYPLLIQEQKTIMNGAPISNMNLDQNINKEMLHDSNFEPKITKSIKTEAKQIQVTEEAKQLQIAAEVEQDQVREEVHQNQVPEEVHQIPVTEEAKQLQIAAEVEQNKVPEEVHQIPVTEETKQLQVPEEVEQNQVPEEVHQVPVPAEVKQSDKEEETKQVMTEQEVEQVQQDELTEPMKKAEEVNLEKKDQEVSEMTKVDEAIVVEKVEKVTPIKEVEEPKQENQEAKQIQKDISSRSEERKIAYVHIGKTGGTTATHLIKTNKDKTHQDQISNQVKEIYHLNTPDIKKYASFIVSARNPVERVISWFLYAHPKNKINKHLEGKVELFQCYDQLADLVTHGLDKKNDDELKTKSGLSCQVLAQSLISGEVPKSAENRQNYIHIVRNYNYYLKDLLEVAEKKEIFVIRTEYFWNDMQKVNKSIGGTNIVPIDTVTHREEKDIKVNSSKMSKAGLKNLCGALCSEIQIYKTLLGEGVNLSEEDREKSMKEVAKLCPREVKIKACTWKPMKPNNIRFLRQTN